MKTLRTLTAIAVVLALAGTAMAQLNSPQAQAQRRFKGSSWSTDTYSAQSYARSYVEYARSVPTVAKEVAQEASDAIGDYITKSVAHMAWMREEAKNANDKTSLASIDVIDKSLADAKKAHDEMHGICLQATVDKTASMKCCQEIDASLQKAIDEHAKLMKRLGLAIPPAKSTTK
jgi:hypothetical protein